MALLALSAVAGPFDVGPVTDARLHVKRGTDVHFDLVHYKSLAEWQAHAKQVREQILTGCGLNPMPKKTPLKAKISGKIDCGDYTIENVTFQSYPGLYVVGNLYRPKGKTGPFPAVLNTHGHGAPGRFVDTKDFSCPARCINFARMGIVAFAYSMIGYNEDVQIKHGVAPTPRQEIWGINPGALQLWNSIRAVDFVSSLPDVDPNRIGVTGESGGGTQTFMLSAVEDRIKANAPVCMISGMMQGGCQCENAPLMRVDSNSVEIGCLMAPRPMLMVAASGDWTKEAREREYPVTREVYKLFGAESNVALYYQNTGHNYNQHSREHVYPWFQKHFLNEAVGDVTPEQPHQLPDIHALMNFQKPPKDALSLDQLTEELISMHEAQLDSFALNSRSSLDRFRRTFGPALRSCFAVSVPKPDEIAAENRGSTDIGNATVTRLVIGRKGIGDAVPALYFTPKTRKPGTPVVMVHFDGKSAALNADDIRAMLAKDKPVLAIDCFLTGESDKHDERLKDKFFTTFYRTDTAERVQDIITALAYLSSRGAANPDLIGLGQSGIDCLFARAFFGGKGATVIDAAGFGASDESFEKRCYVPSIRAAGDVRTAAAMIAPGKLTIGNPGRGFPSEWIRRAYTAAGSAGKTEITDSSLTDKELLGKL